MLPTRGPLQMEDTHKLKRRYFMQMEMEKKAGLAKLVSDKTDFDKGYNKKQGRTLCKVLRSIQQDNIT